MRGFAPSIDVADIGEDAADVGTRFEDRHQHFAVAAGDVDERADRR